MSRHVQTLQANSKPSEREREVVSKRYGTETTWANDDLLDAIDVTLTVFHFSKVPLNTVASPNTASQQQTERERERSSQQALPYGDDLGQ